MSVPPHDALLVGHHSLRTEFYGALEYCLETNHFTALTGPLEWGGLSTPRQHGAGSRAHHKTCDGNLGSVSFRFHDDCSMHRLAMNLAVIFELAGLVEFHRARGFIGFDFAGAEGFAVVVGGGCMLCQRPIRPCHGVANADLECLRLVAYALHLDSYRR